MKRDQIHSQYASPINPFVPRTACHFDFRKPGFPKDALAKTLEGVRLHATDDLEQSILPTLVFSYFLIVAWN